MGFHCRNIQPRREARGAARGTAVKGRPGVVGGAPPAEAGRPKPKETPNQIASRSLWPAGQDEGDSETAVVALAQPARRIEAVEEAINKAPA